MSRPAPSTPRYRLVRPPVPRAAAPVLDPDQRQVVEHTNGPLKVLAGPGTGKTATLVEAVVDRIVHRGVPVEQILVLTFGRRAAAELRDRITARLGRTVREPVARTIHSYAYGVLRLAALREELAAPRLLVAAEQDVVLRDLLTSPERGVVWPESLRPALATHGFADELRDFLARAVDRGLDQVGLAALAEAQGRPDWAAAARFLQEYREVTSWLRPGAFDTAELVATALTTLHRDPALLAAERARRRHVFVDEYQDVDPAQAELLRLVAGSAVEFVVVGDPDQAIYAFRGSVPRALADFDEGLGQLAPPPVTLRTSRRAGAELLAASRRVAARLGAASAHQDLVAAPEVPGGVVEVEVFRSVSDEAAAVAAVLRRAHLEDGAPWSRMAVLVRSVAASGSVLRRALVAAGVPVEVVGDDVPLGEAGAVDALLTALAYLADPPADPAAADDAVEALLLGPLGRADVLTLRRLRRWLGRQERTRPDDLPAGRLALLVERVEHTDAVPLGMQRPVARVAAVLAAGREAEGDLEGTLWRVWQASGLATRWERESVTGGLVGQAADRSLDAVVELFDAAARHVDARDTAAVGEFVEATRSQLLPAARPAGENPDVVRLLTAHAAKGLEWDLVWVAAVQEGLWPDLRRRGSVLGVDRLSDLVTGHTAPGAADTTDHVAVALAEERRLFYVAVTRARRVLRVSAVRDADQAPSRFLDELDPLPVGERPEAEAPARPVAAPPRGLHLAALVAELRAAVTGPDTPAGERAEAADRLAALAEAGVAGAHPRDWWGLAASSVEGPIRDPADGRVRISPSRLEAYEQCELRALLSELGARDGEQPVTASLGTVVHAVASEAPDVTDLADLEARLDVVWQVLDFEAPWHADLTRAAASQYLGRLADWFRTSRGELAELGREIAMRVDVGADATLAGKVDRLEVDASGRTVVVDLKTTSQRVKDADVPEHPQLAAYQLAVHLGAFDEIEGATREPGGGVLVQLKASGKVEQRQAPLTDPAVVEQKVSDLAQTLRGATVLAKVNTGCDRCSVRDSCPAVPSGRQVTA